MATNNPYALNFDTNDYMDLATTPATTTLTIEILLNPQEDLYPYNGCWFGTTNANNRGWMFYRNTVYFYNGSSLISTISLGTLDTDTGWKMLSIVYNGSSLKSYGDGSLIQEKTGLSGTIDNSGVRARLAYPPGSVWPNGKVKIKADEIRFWNVARTPSQINTYKNIKLLGTEPGLIGYWRCDEGTGTTVSDDAGSTDGSISGASWISSDLVSLYEFKEAEDTASDSFTANEDYSAEKATSDSLSDTFSIDDNYTGKKIILGENLLDTFSASESTFESHKEASAEFIDNAAFYDTTNQLMYYLVDTYNDNSPNYSLWGATLSGFEIYEQNQRIEIYCDHTGHGYLWSVDNYCIRNSSMYIHLEAVPISRYLHMDFFLTDPDGPSVGFALFNGNLHIYNGAYSVYSEAFNGTNHQYLRIRGDLTNIYFEVSSDCKTWNSFYSLTNAESGINADNVYPTFGAGTTDYVADLEYVAFDSFNIQEFAGAGVDSFTAGDTMDGFKTAISDPLDVFTASDSLSGTKAALSLLTDTFFINDTQERYAAILASALFSGSLSYEKVLRMQNSIIAELDIKNEIRKVF